MTAQTQLPAILRQLPLSMADFERRRFRLDRPEHRRRLEEHARSFLHGANLAVDHWRDPHDALATVPEIERGFAYEGAAMYAAGRDAITGGRARAVTRLASGPGDGYIHLIHVGTGWFPALTRLPMRLGLTSSPLLRWLALDGAGFARAFFARPRALERMCRTEPDGTHVSTWRARMSGVGRALWFVESAHPDSIADRLSTLPPRVRGPLWAGVGLASAYAGALTESDAAALLHRSRDHRSDLLQGVAFGVAARHRSGIVPSFTSDASQYLLGTHPEDVAGWTSAAAEGLDADDVITYELWRTRLRELVAAAAKPSVDLSGDIR